MMTIITAIAVGLLSTLFVGLIIVWMMLEAIYGTLDG
jgi:hypothetical protein